jgi:hypothetical protein
VQLTQAVSDNFGWNCNNISVPVVFNGGKCVIFYRTAVDLFALRTSVNFIFTIKWLVLSVNEKF